ncbi:MAG TPA: FAD-dependent oxidoreductase [Beijerinckiaceae bacterium]|nr:FAD-dependent oxidoreductase [Beijerinckiaceae bacterium]
MTLCETADVVVIGAGCAGLCSAVEAAEKGLRVVVLEKLESSLHSSSAASGGYFAFVGTDLQRKVRILDSDKDFRADMSRNDRGLSDPALVDLYLANQLDTYYWLQMHGAVFWHVDLGIGMNVPRCHATDPQRVLEILTRAARRLGVTIVYNWAVERVDREERGLTIGGPGGALVRATRGAVLASGGFSRNPAMLGRFVPGLERVKVVDGGLGATGDGIVIAERLGAGVTSMDCVKPNFYSYAFREQQQGTMDRFQHETPVGMVYHLGGILVAQSGRRYVREDMNAKDIALVTLGLPEAMSWGIYDESVRQRALDEKTIYINPSAMEKALRADTPAELAQLAGISQRDFVETVENYNANCVAGRPDPLGRQYQTALLGRPFALTKPPFYAFPTAPNMATTFGGLRINSDAQILDVNNIPIPGLYACGEIVGGFHGMNFVTGTALAQAAIFGRIAAMSIAKRADPQGAYVVPATAGAR